MSFKLETKHFENINHHHLNLKIYIYRIHRVCHMILYWILFFFAIIILHTSSGSVELNDSRNISMDYEKASSLSSDESMQMCAATAVQGSSVPTTTKKLLQHTPSTKYRGTTPNTLLIQPFVHLGQSLPNLNLNASQTTNNTLLVPGTSSGHSNLLSPSQRGISYPPPSPTR